MALCSSFYVLESHSDAVSAKAASYFIVNSRVVFSFTCVTISGYFPVLMTSPDKLRITRQNIEGQFCLRSIELGDKIEQTLPSANSLIIWQHHQPAYSIVFCSHTNTGDGYERYRLCLVNCSVTPNTSAEPPV